MTMGVMPAGAPGLEVERIANRINHRPQAHAGTSGRTLRPGDTAPAGGEEVGHGRKRGFRPLMARQVMEPRTERSLWSLPTGAIRHRRACERSESSGAARRRTRPPGQPPATLLAAFEPSLHFVDLVHALDDDAAGRGGDFVLEGAEAHADVDAPFDGSLDGLRVHVVCSVVASVGSGDASLRDAIRRSASGQPLPPVGAGRTSGAHRDRFQ